MCSCARWKHDRSPKEYNPPLRPPNHMTLDTNFNDALKRMHKTQNNKSHMTYRHTAGSRFKKKNKSIPRTKHVKKTCCLRQFLCKNKTEKGLTTNVGLKNQRNEGSVLIRFWHILHLLTFMFLFFFTVKTFSSVYARSSFLCYLKTQLSFKPSCCPWLISQHHDEVWEIWSEREACISGASWT